MWRVWEFEEKIVLFLYESGQLSLHGFGLGRQALVFGQERLHLVLRRLVALEFADFLAALPHIGHPAFDLVGQIPPAGVDFQYPGEVPIATPSGERARHRFGVVSDEANVKQLVAPP